ncbi:MAG TPA: substrate-binding domain-containing protein [Caulobacteraceae bacterium]|nr:substrate-binding domain-containing protein [Caulobacteraceae bacterium]
MGRGHRTLRPLAALLIVFALGGCGWGQRPLRVCEDPNNLPFSNARAQGFENRIIRIIAKALGRKVEYTWWAQRRGFARNTLKGDKCDIWPGVASGVETMATTRPYYRSTYVFVTRADHGPPITSFDDPRLRKLKIGVQLIGNDATNTPPTHALARRGIIDNVRGYMIYGDYRRPNPPADIVKAVDDGDIDVAIAWGPLAGYFAQRARHKLAVTPVSPWLDGPNWPMVFDISMGVRKDDAKLKRQVDLALAQHRSEIAKILAEFGVPIVPDPTQVDGG